MKKTQVKMKRDQMPLYIRIKSAIIHKISSGELKKGDRLPSERELAQTLGVARITVVGALKELADEGVIEKVHGKGSFIANDQFEDDYEDIFAHITGKHQVEITYGMFKPTAQYRLIIRTLASLFQLENPDIKVKPVDIEPAANASDDVFLLKMVSGTAPTVSEFYMHADYAALNGLIPLESLDGFTEMSSTLRPQSIYETADAAGDMHIHSLAIKLNSRLILGNKELLQEAGINCNSGPADWDELKSWIAQLGDYTLRKKNGSYGFFAGLPDGWHNIIGLYPFLWGQQPDYANSTEGFKQFVNAGCFQQGLSYLKRLFEKGNHAPVNGLDLFATGQVGIILSGQSWPFQLLEMVLNKFDIAVYKLPSANAYTPLTSVVGGYGVGIFRSAVRNDDEIEAAWKWIKFLFRKQQQFALTADLTFPALECLPGQLEKNYPEASDVFKQALDSGMHQFDFKNVRSYLNIIGIEMRKCFTGNVSVKQCTQSIKEHMKHI